MTYRIRGLDPAPFRHLYGLDDAALAAEQVVRMKVTAKPDAPCRVELVDVDPGETVLLVNYEHLPVATPYRSAHAIFVREGAEDAAEFVDTIPEPLAIRLLSVRAFDADGMMTDADVFEGSELDRRIEEFFADPRVAYLHAHNAGRGCFAARIDRA
ncbi:DUF1203 domain-containing protein [Sphingomonas cannabina]|uniref:DUF1203 domain-containing protein n=1 Tax=Sphingomonas cannabina TaxID=2899123 RepID=UPI001F18A1E5|nr:DUF1203 domain-containing protein [Sphingomonas cannabina]UIJ46720.1 DUF1203 domain-containing protein [Sphingomonas cannabina]